MKLKSIEMQGFKSFPDKTRITFDSGVTAIIGPNGSGKSNISDAVRWVLGEMSMKSLRGSRMEDVIFNGAPGRPAANCSSVSITLDTTEEYDLHSQTFMSVSGDEPEPDSSSSGEPYRLYDGTEVTVTRRYYRSGESEYYINKKQVRLKDIYELFYDTGIGREGYSVISQGKISEVLSQKGSERRDIFEEAAGISKYRYKKAEAERRLAETEVNLTRVGDILSEVSARVGPLEKEAENAKKYLVLSEEKKGLEITLWLDRLDALRKDTERNSEQLAGARAALDSAESDAALFEEKLDGVMQRSFDLGREISEAERSISEYEKASAAVDAEKALRRNDAEHYRRLSEEYAAEVTRLGREKELSDDMLSSAAEVGASLKAELEQAMAVYADAEREYDGRRAESEQLAAVEQSVSGKYTAAFESVSALREKYARLRAEYEQAERIKAETDQKLSASEERLAQLGAELEEAAARTAEASESVDEAGRDIAGLDGIIAENREKKEAAAASRAAASLAADTLSGRRDNLVRMEALFEGYSDGVRAVLGQAKSGGLKGIVGTVSSIISADERFVTALETALGASSQSLVTETEEDAKNAVRYLKRTSSGRATFLPVETVKGARAEESAIRGMRGYLGIASDSVRCDIRYRRVMDDLLGRTVLAEDMDSAASIARAASYRIKAVTLDGQVINPGGSITGGTPHRRAGVFTRAMDIERLTAEINEKISEAEKFASDEKELDAEYSSLCERRGALSAAADAAKATLDECTRREDGCRVRLEEEKRHRSETERDTDAAVSDSGTAAADAEASLLTAEAELAELRLALETAKTDSAAAKRAESDSFETANRLRLGMYEKKSASERQEQHIKALTEKRDGIAARMEENRAASVRAAESAENSEKRAVEYDSRRDEALLGAEQCRAKLNELVSLRDSAEKDTVEAREAVREAQARKEEAVRRCTGLESRAQNLASEFDTVTSKLWEEYELTYNTASPLRLPPEKMDSAATRVASLRAKIRAMGHINVNAVEEYAAEKERFDFLTAQTEDLNNTRRQLDTAIDKLSRTMRDTFTDCFDRINEAFGRTFSELFGGGSARVELEDADNPLDCGIDIIIHPPGKSVRSISLLSGGEQSFAAIALYLALQEINPSPFCIFDEIESALDDVNLIKFADYVRSHSESTQYILITHRRGTMERADVLYGVTMYEKGVSEYLRLNLDMLEENIKKYGTD